MLSTPALPAKSVSCQSIGSQSNVYISKSTTTSATPTKQEYTVRAATSLAAGDLVERGVVTPACTGLASANDSVAAKDAFNAKSSWISGGSGYSLYYKPSGTPNVGFRYFHDRNRFEIYALRDVSANEELTYADEHAPASHGDSGHCVQRAVTTSFASPGWNSRSLRAHSDAVPSSTTRTNDLPTLLDNMPHCQDATHTASMTGSTTVCAPSLLPYNEHCLPNDVTAPVSPFDTSSVESFESDVSYIQSSESDAFVQHNGSPPPAFSCRIIEHRVSGTVCDLLLGDGAAPVSRRKDPLCREDDLLRSVSHLSLDDLFGDEVHRSVSYESLDQLHGSDVTELNSTPFTWDIDNNERSPVDNVAFATKKTPHLLSTNFKMATKPGALLENVTVQTSATTDNLLSLDSSLSSCYTRSASNLTEVDAPEAIARNTGFHPVSQQIIG
eukprot:GEMP01004488.1.p1 GENE.GEMP01004488.1~~GEMP01004488.1.p1  ORF type:complete len:442 (-),score=83.05 GEMP01004488.1:2310-3635(-)